MAKYEELYDDTIELVKEILITIDERNLMEIKMRADNNQKQLIKLFKANDLNKELGNYEVAIVINQKIFELLPEAIQLLSLTEALTGLSYNDDGMKTVINKEDVSTHSGFLQKYGYENFRTMRETINLIYAQEKEREEEQKAAAKMGK